MQWEVVKYTNEWSGVALSQWFGRRLVARSLSAQPLPKYISTDLKQAAESAVSANSTSSD